MKRHNRPDNRHNRIIEALAAAGYAVQLTRVNDKLVQRGIIRAQAVNRAA